MCVHIRAADLLLPTIVLQLDDLRAGSDASLSAESSRSKVKQDQLAKLVGSSLLHSCMPQIALQAKVSELFTFLQCQLALA
jgi:hypothetical protein